MSTVIQRNLARGEISPSLQSRVDTNAYQTGVKTLRNFLVKKQGGADSRPGTEFVGEVKDSSKRVRLIPFIFNADQTYTLEFGDLYMRVIEDGAYVETAPGVPFEMVTTYLEADLPTLQFVQSADVLTISHLNYPPREVSRLALTNWTIADVVIGPSVATPATPTNNRGAIDLVEDPDIEWVVTRLDTDTGEESLPSVSTYLFKQDSRTANIVSGGTRVGAGDMTLNGPSEFVSGGVATMGQPARIRISSTADYSAQFFTIFGTDQNANTFSEKIAGPKDNQYTETVGYFKTVTRIAASFGVGTALNVGIGDVDLYPVTISWTAVASATYRIYKATAGIFGLIGEVTQGAADTSANFIDADITPDFTNTPPFDRQPFASSNNPSAVTYYQQRLLFANSDNNPQTTWASRTGLFKNFSIRRPIQDDDAVTFTLASRQVNRIKHLLDLGKLWIFTTAGEHIVQGDTDEILKPSAINPKQRSYYGSSDLSPIVIGENALFVQARGSIVRDLSNEIQADGYRGNDLTTFSSHLVEGYTLTDWTYAQTPNSIVWAVRDDGTLLGLTYIREQQIFGWHRHDFDGEVESVCAIPEGLEDALYLSVKRTINGSTKRYIERMSTRRVDDIKDFIGLDCALSYDGRNTGATTMTLSGGSTWAYSELLTLTASSASFTSSDVGNEVQLTGSDGEFIRFRISAYTSTTVVSGHASRDVPASLRTTATSDWALAVDEVSGLDHLEGKDVSVFADGFVVASPNNPSYSTLTVSGGSITLDRPYGVIHVGLPITSDIETLSIDTAQGESMIDKRKLITKVSAHVEKSRGFFAGTEEPEDDGVDGLYETKLRENESYDDPISLRTEVVELNIEGSFSKNGQVFIRNVDPTPLTIESIAPAGLIPIRGA